MWDVVISFLFVLRYFLNSLLHFFFSLTQWSFKNLLCSFHMLMTSFIFLLLLIFGFIQLFSKKIIDVILFLLGLFRLILWLNMWSTLDNIPWFLNKNVYRHISFYSSSQTPWFFVLFCFVFFTNWGFVSTLHWVSLLASFFQQHLLTECLCLILIILTIFPTFHFYYIFIIICNQSS